MQKENQVGREDLLETIREMQEDLYFYKGICEVAFKEEEILKIRSKSKLDKLSGLWDIPIFSLKSKEVVLPTIKKNRGKNMY